MPKEGGRGEEQNVTAALQQVNCRDSLPPSLIFIKEQECKVFRSEFRRGFLSTYTSTAKNCEGTFSIVCSMDCVSQLDPFVRL